MSFFRNHGGALTSFVLLLDFYMCLIYPNNKIRYVREEFLVSDLVVVADPWDEFYRLDFGAMLTINLTLEIGYRANFYLILETGGGLLLATKPHQRFDFNGQWYN